MDKRIEIRIHGETTLPTLIYLPGLHGDWTLVASLRVALAGRVRFVEFTYPRTITWSLEEHADAVLAELARCHITQGWLLGESFGSQIVWQLLAKSGPNQVGPAHGHPRFQPTGVILSGGFVRFPFLPGVKLAQILLQKLPVWAVRTFLRTYATVARLRHYRAPETRASVREFISRRTPEDIAAMVHRLRLIHSNDVRAMAAAASVPVFQLVGCFDPMVPALAVRRWLAGNCPTYRGTKTIWLADHNVLGTAPAAAAAQIFQWMQR